MSRVCPKGKIKRFNSEREQGTSIRVHGSGNYIIASEYHPGQIEPKKSIASCAYLRKAIDESVPVWIDTERMSPVQFASVIRAVDDIKAKDDEVSVTVVHRDGRRMVLAKRNGAKTQNQKNKSWSTGGKR